MNAWVNHNLPSPILFIKSWLEINIEIDFEKFLSIKVKEESITSPIQPINVETIGNIGFHINWSRTLMFMLKSRFMTGI